MRTLNFKIINNSRGNIKKECYDEKHIHVLQTIINSNQSLEGLKPLELGREVGYQKWKNH